MTGRPIRGFIGGFILGIFVDIDLVFGGVVKLNSIVLTILPVALLVVGLVLGLWAPLGRVAPAPAGAPIRTFSPTPSPPAAPPAAAPPEAAASEAAAPESAAPEAPAPEAPAGEDSPPI